MCIGVPMKVIESGFGRAVCDDRGEQKTIDTMLVGEQPPGTWLLVFIDAAREVIPAAEAAKIIDALQALEEVMNGNANIDHLFADLTNTETDGRS